MFHRNLPRCRDAQPSLNECLALCGDQLMLGYVHSRDSPSLQALYAVTDGDSIVDSEILPSSSHGSPVIMATPSQGRDGMLPFSLSDALDAFDADSLRVDGEVTGEIVADTIADISIAKSPKPVPPAKVTVASILANSEDLDLFSSVTPSRSKTTEALAAELFMKDQQELLKRQMGSKLGVGAPLASIPEIPSGNSGRRQLPSGAVSGVASMKTPLSSSTASSRQQTQYRYYGPSGLGGLAASSMIQEPEVDVFGGRRVSSSLLAAGHALHYKLEKRPREHDVKHLIRVSTGVIIGCGTSCVDLFVVCLGSASNRTSPLLRTLLDTQLHAL